MVIFSSLKTHYQRGVHSPLLDSAIESILEKKEVAIEPLYHSAIWDSKEFAHQPLFPWYTLLTLSLITYLASLSPNLLTPAWERLLKQSKKSGSSLHLEILITLNSWLLTNKAPEVHLQKLESGAIPIQLSGDLPWQTIPYSPQHAELGTLLCLLALLTKREDFKAAVAQLVKWHLNTLDAQLLPLNGLFTQESHCNLGRHLIWNYLLFHGAAQLLNEPQFEAIGQAALAHFAALSSSPKHPSFVLPLCVLLEQALTTRSLPSSSPPLLSSKIYDPSTALVGERFSDSHIVCTLHGRGTGLGCFRSGDVEVINYGPQYLPLGECKGFGIEGYSDQDKGIRKSNFLFHPSGFCLKGHVRLIDEPSQTRLGNFRGIWLAVEQKVENKILEIGIECLGLTEWKGVAFSFFVKAQSCHIYSVSPLYPCTFDHYQGPIQPITLEGKTESVEITTPHSSGTLHVIPLGGGDYFWGADFLIAYLLDPLVSHYQWCIQPLLQKTKAHIK